MKIRNISFTKHGWDSFKELTRKEQRETLKNADKSISDKELDNLLKSVSYGKSKESKPKTKKSNTKQASNRGSDNGGAVEGTESSKG